MARSIRLAAAVAFAGAILLMSWSFNAVCIGSGLEYPNQSPNCCIPNVRNFGYYRTTWRQWPGQQRPEQNAPRTRGGEIIPTPKGIEVMPPPKAAIPKPPNALFEGEILPPESPIPDSPTAPSKDEPILPSEGKPLPGILPEGSWKEPDLKKPQKPLLEGEQPSLPGLPVEPDKSPAPGAAEDVKPVEPPKPERAPLKESTSARPPKVEALRLRPWQRTIEPVQKMVVPFVGHQMQHGTVVSVAGSIEPERNPGLAGVYHANPIAVAASEALASRIEPAAYATAEPPAQVEVSDQIVVPPEALNGYCPVELIDNGRWTKGDLRWTVVHGGRIYRLSGPTQRQQFLEDPNRFVPVNSGNDPVLLVDENRTVVGRPAYCATYFGRLYMFSSAATQAQFNKAPGQYATEE